MGAAPQKLDAAPFLLKECGVCSTNKINPRFRQSKLSHDPKEPNPCKHRKDPAPKSRQALQLQQTLVRTISPRRTSGRTASWQTFRASIDSSIRTAITDHLRVRYSHVAMFGGVLAHAMFFRLALRIFLRAMHSRIGNHAGNSDRMSHMRCKFDRVTFDFPGAAVLGG